jgi:hypothetical protein
VRPAEDDDGVSMLERAAMQTAGRGMSRLRPLAQGYQAARGAVGGQYVPDEGRFPSCADPFTTRIAFCAVTETPTCRFWLLYFGVSLIRPIFGEQKCPATAKLQY